MIISTWGAAALIAILAGGLLAAVGGALAWFLYARRLQRRLAAQDDRLAALERQLAALCDGTRGMGDALRSAEQRLRKVSARQNELDLRSPEQRTYQRAIELVRRGADARELMEACGLDRSEAELVHLLHGQGRARAGSRLAS